MRLAGLVTLSLPIGTNTASKGTNLPSDVASRPRATKKNLALPKLVSAHQSLSSLPQPWIPLSEGAFLPNDMTDDDGMAGKPPNVRRETNDLSVTLFKRSSNKHSPGNSTSFLREPRQSGRNRPKSDNCNDLVSQQLDRQAMRQASNPMALNLGEQAPASSKTFIVWHIFKQPQLPATEGVVSSNDVTGPIRRPQQLQQTTNNTLSEVSVTVKESPVLSITCNNVHEVSSNSECVSILATLTAPKHGLIAKPKI